MRNQSLAARLLVLSLVLILLFSCDLAPIDRTSTPTPSPAPSQCRESSEPTEEDVDHALAFNGQVLDDDDWQRTYQVQTDRVRVTWTSDDGGLIFLESIIYPCGYTSDDVEHYFSRENIEQIIYADYQNVTIRKSCRNDDQDLQLFEIAAMWDGQPYAIRHWVLAGHPTRMVNVLIAFPETLSMDLMTYAERLFPKLVSCPD